jgi:hypothetical protein
LSDVHGGDVPGSAPPPPPAFDPAPAAPLPPPVGVAPEREKRGWRTWQALLLALIALLIGIGIGAASSSSSDDSKSGDQAAAAADSSTSSSTTSTTRATTTTVAYVPVPADFTIDVIETERSCFGSAGCNVTYTIKPNYVGAQLPSASDTFTVVYEVRGGTDSKTGNFTVTGSQVSYDKDDLIQTATGSKLTAVPTQVVPG